MNREASIGAFRRDDGRCRFRVWAPNAERVELCILEPERRDLLLDKGEDGYHQASLDGVQPGTRYGYRLDGQNHLLPDPASRFQPDGVHGASAVTDRSFDWTDAGWTAPRLRDYVIYELHVATFTAEGTFDAACSHLRRLRELGITAIELMPVAQFPGERNWGYDGVDLFAVQSSYGGPEGLKRLVDACHGAGLAVILDVVYNHVGPEGNYLGEFGPYFTDRYSTPWAPAMNFDGPESDEVRHFFIENALYWIADFHIDALRLDAVHAILDTSADPFLQELTEAVHEGAEQLARRVYVIAESDLNDPRLIRPPVLGGFGMDAQWADDFHHALHALLTPERGGYYQDFGEVADLARAIRDGYTYSGQYSAYRRRRHGNDPRSLPAERFVVCAQNHDQVGNRTVGERISELVPFPAQKLAAGVLLLSPFVPLLFMGQEYGETAPFPYFVSHGDAELVDTVRRGRIRDLAVFDTPGEPPDPQAPETFQAAKLDHDRRHHGARAALYRLHGELLRLRREIPALTLLSKNHLQAVAYEDARLLLLRRWDDDGDEIGATFHFGTKPAELELPFPAARWRKLLDSEDAQWEGRGSGIPGALDSAGEVRLTLAPLAFTLWVRDSA